MIPSPIVVGDYVLMVNDGGVASCLAADTGELQWRERLGTKYFASPVSANGLVYFMGIDGVTKVIRPGPTFELVAENGLGEVGQQCYRQPSVLGVSSCAFQDICFALGAQTAGRKGHPKILRSRASLPVFLDAYCIDAAMNWCDFTCAERP